MGNAYGVQPVVDVDLPVDVLEMLLHRSWRGRQLPGDAARGVACAKQLKHQEFPGGQPEVSGRCGAGEAQHVEEPDLMVHGLQRALHRSCDGQVLFGEIRPRAGKDEGLVFYSFAVTCDRELLLAPEGPQQPGEELASRLPFYSGPIRLALTEMGQSSP